MRIRAIAKRFLYGSRITYRGTFPYYGHNVYFPFESHLFERACQEGVYEKEVVALISSLVRPNTTYIDVGANIGLLAIPILKIHQDVDVISIEASPDIHKHLELTREDSPHRKRWSIVSCACGEKLGKAAFYISKPSNSAFNGLKDTGRGGIKTAITVNVKPLDDIWSDAGGPNISVIKIDVEGAEAEVIAGAKKLIAEQRPALVIEWSRLNLPAYEILPERLFELCQSIGYRAYACHNLCFVDSEFLLRAAMVQTETFLLLPNQ